MTSAEEVILATLAIVFALFLLVALVYGAIFLLGFAAEQGFVGLAAYVACWVFLLPVMATASVLSGLYVIYIKITN